MFYREWDVKLIQCPVRGKHVLCTWYVSSLHHQDQNTEDGLPCLHARETEACKREVICQMSQSWQVHTHIFFLAVKLRLSLCDNEAIIWPFDLLQCPPQRKLIPCLPSKPTHPSSSKYILPRLPHTPEHCLTIRFASVEGPIALSFSLESGGHIVNLHVIQLLKMVLWRGWIPESPHKQWEDGKVQESI